MADQRHDGEMRPSAAFLLAPVPAAALMAPLIASDSLDHNPLPFFAYFLLLLWGTQLIFAAPMRWLQTRRHRALSVVGDTIIGLIAGGLPALGYGLWLSSFYHRPGMPIIAAVFVVLFAIMGAMTGLTHGLLRRGDRDAKMVPMPADLARRFD